MNFTKEIIDSERVAIPYLIAWMLPASRKRVWTDFDEFCNEKDS